jgi:tetratricopeptide (TPR) repeat protein
VDDATSHSDGRSVAHLVELGYRDPVEEAAERRREAESLEAGLQQAQRLLNGGDVTQALPLLGQLADQWPQAAGPRWLLAQAEYRRGNLAAAGEYLFWLQMHGFERADFSLLWARIALAQRRLNEALEHAEYARFLHDPLPAADVIVGELHFRRGELELAAAEYQRALDHDDRNAAGLAGLAAVALRRGDFEAAVDWGLQSVEIDARPATTHYRLGLALMHLGHKAEAQAAFEAAMRLNPRLRGPRRWLSQLSS